jgi:hypothetical protein
METTRALAVKKALIGRQNLSQFAKSVDLL